MMWVNPKYAHEAAPKAQPPVENGKCIAAFKREGGQGRADEQLRVTIAEYNDHPYIGLRVWSVDRDGQWWPVKGKGVSIRVTECADMIAALTKALERLDTEQSHEQR